MTAWRRPPTRIIVPLALVLALRAASGAEPTAPSPENAAVPTPAPALSTAPAAFSPTSAPDPPKTGFARWLDPDTAPFLPIPEIDTSPSSGITLGLIPVLLSNNAQGQIDQILAPDVIHSQYFGWGARWRTFRNPTDDERWSVVGGGKQHTESEFDAQYERGILRNGRWSWRVEAIYDRSGTDRFFGLGNDSNYGNQTSYVDAQSRLEGRIGFNFNPTTQLSYMARYVNVDIENGVLPQLPSTLALFPDLPGIGHQRELQSRVVLTYDTRDSAIAPTHGERLAVFAGVAEQSIFTHPEYAYEGVDATVLAPVRRGVTIAAHAALRYMPSYANAPFWALSAIGGDRSVLAEEQPLRAFAEGRFVDRNASSASLEVRLSALALHLFATDLSFEPAPFIDAGKVFNRPQSSPVTHPNIAGGLGLRMIARPYIVGYVDVGFGKDGVTVFSGIDYPF